MRVGSDERTATAAGDEEQPSGAGASARSSGLVSGLMSGLTGGLAAHSETLRLRVVVFVAGMAALALEMCAPRLLGPYFGTSLFVWANIIGFFLIYLALGYFLGGRIADRYPNYRLLAALTTIAALFIAIIPFISSPVLNWSVQGLDNVEAGVFYSSMVAVILLFAVPVTFL